MVGICSNDRLIIWNAWLGGDPLSWIHSYDVPHLSLRKIRQVLRDPVPHSLAGDPRLQGRRYLWVAADGIILPSTGQYASLVIFRHPRKITQRAMTRALAKAASDLRRSHPGAAINSRVLERFEVDDADLVEHLIADKGYPAWSFDENGVTTRLDPKNLATHPVRQE